TFSDPVGKDLAGILRDIAHSNQTNRIQSSLSNLRTINTIDNKNNEGADLKIQDTEIVNDNIKESTYAKPQNNESLVFGTGTYPSMKAIVMSSLPSSETEWVIVYAFYSSNFGENTFSRKDILTKYEESSRKTEQRRKNLTGSLTSAV